MKEFIIIGLALIGLITYGVDYFILSSTENINLAEARVELWMKAFFIYLILLIPPYIMLDRDRYETAAIVAETAGAVVVKISTYISIGMLIYLGWYLASSVF